MKNRSEFREQMDLVECIENDGRELTHIERVYLSRLQSLFVVVVNPYPRIFFFLLIFRESGRDRVRQKETSM